MGEWTYELATEYLASFKDWDSLCHGPDAYDRLAPEIDEFRALLKRIGEPQRANSTIHVAGTKGKGSTTAFLHRILSTAGYRTGRYTSPHVASYTERLSDGPDEVTRETYAARLLEASQIIDGGAHVRRWLRRRRWARLLPGLVKPVMGSVRASQRLTCLAMLLELGREDIEFKVVETHIGGTVDFTNVFTDMPRDKHGLLINVITTMGIEHTQVLGTTIDRISGHKAGIIQPQGFTVLGVQREQWAATVRNVMCDRARQMGQPPLLDVASAITYLPESVRVEPSGTTAVFRLNPEVVRDWSCGVMEARRRAGLAVRPVSDTHLFDALAAGLELTSPLGGRHQLDNLCTVLAVLLLMDMCGVDIPPEAVRRGVVQTQWPARFEIMSLNPLVIVDCCHEPLSVETFVKTFEDMFGRPEVIAVSGFARDNNAKMLCEIGKRHLNVVGGVCCRLPLGERARSAKQGAKIMQQVYGVPIEAIDDPRAAVRRGLEMRTGNQAVLVFDAFYVTTAAREIIREFQATKSVGRKEP